MDNESFEKIMSESDCALFLACYKVDSAKIETALQNGANVNAVFSGACPGIDCPRIYQGYTPILIVAEKVFGISEEKDEFRQRLLRSLEILLKYGADINATADNGSVCVLADAAVYESDCEILRFLLEHGADPNIPYDHGGSILDETAFHIDEDRTENWLTPSEKVCAAVDLLMDYGAMSWKLRDELKNHGSIGAVRSLDENAVRAMKHINKYDIGNLISEIVQLNRKHFRNSLDVLEAKTLSMIKLLVERDAAKFDRYTLPEALHSGFVSLIDYLLSLEPVIDKLPSNGLFEDEVLFWLQGYQHYWSEEKFNHIRKKINDILNGKCVDVYRQAAENSPFCHVLLQVWADRNTEYLKPFCRSLEINTWLDQYLASKNGTVVEVRKSGEHIELLWYGKENGREFVHIVKFTVADEQIEKIRLSIPDLDFCTGEKCWEVKNNLTGFFKQRMEKLISHGVERLKKAAAGDDFFQNVPKNLPDLWSDEWYWDNFGHILNSDCAKLAFIKQGYQPENPESVSKFHTEVSNRMYMLVREMLYGSQSDIYAGKTVIFMAGGNGSGKSTFCDGIRPYLGEDWVIDATLASLETARNTLEEVFALGANAVIIHIIREPKEAWENGVVKRAAHGSHCTPRKVFEYTHKTVADNVATLEREFARKGLQVYRIENK